MSKSIDERILSMRFDNRQFESRIQDTLRDIEALNSGLKFEGASEGLEQVNKEFKKLDASRFEKSIDVVILKFEQLSATAFTIVSRLTNAVIDFGKKTIDAFAIEPVTTGFNEYELKMASVQTIMAATGASVATVNAYLDELNEYSDRTIYSFADMTNNIGKFTNAGVGLKDAVAAIKGVSNEAALAGANANEASRAMYNFAQALATGSVKLIDWVSIEKANMATVQFKEQLLETAAEMGTIEKDASGMYRVLTRNGTGSNMKELISSTRNFNDSLSYQWMTSEVLIETLKKYSDETLEIGQKAYAAAQDVKTFSMMMDTLKESAQSGWAETWQLIVGDFEQAKGLWTTITTFFDEIIGNSAKARNELLRGAMELQNADGLTGREALWNSLINILENVRNILSAVKKAWEDVFPPVTDQKLRHIIENFHNWTEMIKLSDDQLNKLRSTFKGIFALLDMFITICRFTFRVGVQLIQKFMYVMKVVLFAGFALLLQWIEKVRNSTTGFYGWLNGIGTGIWKFLQYVKSLDGITLSNLFGTLRSFGENVIGSFLDYKTLLSNLTSIKDFVGWIFEAIAKGIGVGVDYLKVIFSDFLPWLESAKDKFVEIFRSLKEKFESGEISIDTVVMIAVGAGLILLILSFKKFLKSISEIAEGISGVFSSISKTIKAFAQRIKAESVSTIAKTIGILVTSLAVLVILSNDKEKLLTALAVLGALSAGFVAISFAISKMDTKSTVAFASAVAAFGLTISALATALSKIKGLSDSGGIKGSLKILAGLIAGMLVVMKLLGSADKQYSVGAVTMLSFVLTLKLMIGVLEDFRNADLTGINTSLKIMLEIALGLALVGKGFQNVRFGAAAAMLASVVALKSVLSSIESLKDYDPAVINKALNAILKVFAMFAGLMIAAGIVNRNLEKFENTTAKGVKKGYKSSTNLKQLAVAVLAMSASLVIISKAFKSISALSDEELDRSGKVITKILLVYGAVVALSKFAGENADKAGKMIMKMSSSIVILTTFVALLGSFVDVTSLNEPMKVIERLMVFIALIVASTALVPDTDNMAKVFTGLTIAVVALAGAVAAMTFLPNLDSVNEITKALVILMGGFALMVASTKLAGKVSGTLITLTGIMVIMGGIIAMLSELYVARAIENASGVAILMGALAISMKILSTVGEMTKGVMPRVLALSGIAIILGTIVGALNFTRLGNAIQNATGVGILLTSLAISMKILQGSNALEKGVIKQLAQIGLIVIELGVVIGALNYTNLGAAISNATAIGILLLAITESIRLLQDQQALGDNVIKQMAQIGLVVGELGLIVGLMSQFGWQASITNVIAIGTLLAGIVASFKLLQNTDALDKGITGQLAILAGIMAATGAVVAWLEKHDMSVSLQNSIALGLLLNALVLAMRQLQGAQEIDPKALLMLAGMSLVLGLVQVIVGGLTALGFSVAIDNAIALSALLVALSAAALVASAAGLTGPAGLAGVAILAALIAAVGGIMALIVSITKDNPTVEGDLDRAIMVLTKLGNGLGSFFGGIVNGVLKAIDFNILSSFGYGFKGFTSGMAEALEGLDGVKQDNISKLKNLAEAVLVITASELLNGLSRLFNFGMSGIGLFGLQLNTLGIGIKKFSNETSSIQKSTGTDYAIEVLKKLAEIGKEIPNAGGAISWIVGDNKLDDFADQFPKLASGLVSFCYRIKNIDQGPQVDFAIDTLTKLASAAHEIPNFGTSLVSLLIGDNKMDDFADQMPTLANGLVSFCYKVRNIDMGPNAEFAIGVMQKLAKASEEIPNTGGWLGAIVGNNDMGPFAEGMPVLGQGLYEFCSAIKDLDDSKVDMAISVLDKLVDASKDLEKKGGLVQGIWGSTDIMDFGARITWLGQYLSIYAAWIGQITNFEDFYTSTLAVKQLAEVAQILSTIPAMNTFSGLPEELESLGKDVKAYADSVKGIKIDGIKDSLLGLEMIIATTNEIMNGSGFPKVKGELGIKKWADEVTWLGQDLYTYWTWIDITNFDDFNKPVEAVKTIVAMANEISSVDTRKFNLFGENLVKFVKEDFKKVADAFKSVDFADVGVAFTDSLVKSIRDTRGKFVDAADYVIQGFISGVQIKMSENGAIEKLGFQLGDVLVTAMENRLDIHSPSKVTQYIGNMVVDGLKKGVIEKLNTVDESGQTVGSKLVGSIINTIGLNSDNNKASAIGKGIINSISSGMHESANKEGGLYSQFSGMWNNLQVMANNGMASLKNIISDTTGLDISAGIGETLNTAAKNLKKKLLGDGIDDYGFKFSDVTDGLFDDVQETMSSITSSFADESSSTGKTSASELSDALKRELHKHFDSYEYRYLGQQLGETLGIAANGAIVGKMNIANDLYDEIQSITSRGYDEWKAWLEVRNKYEQISTKDQLAGWELLRQKYAEGTKERMEADEQVYSLQKQLVKETYEYSKKWIDNEKFYERLSLEEEIAAWERIQARYMEGSEERIEAEKQLYTLRKELRQKDIEDQKKWIENEKKYERAGLADELAAYIRMQQLTEEGSDERADIDYKIYELRKEIYEAQLQYTEDVTAAQEEAAEKRAALEEEYAEKVKEINEKLASDIEQLNEQYANAVEQRAKSLYSAYGLFDAVKDQDYDKDELMTNLEDQVRAFEEWQMTLNSLAARGLDKGLIDELTEMGPSAKGQLEALNSMTDAELGQYNLLWSQKSAMAREQAVGELEYLRVETAENIAKLQQTAAEELDEYRKTWSEAMSKVTSDCTAKLEQLRKTFGELVGTIKKDTNAKLQEMTEVSNKILREAGWSVTGQQIVNGIISGINLNKWQLISVVTNIGLKTLAALKNALKVHSPSKETEWIGEMTGKGLIKGLESYNDKANDAGYNLGEEIQNGAFEAVKYVNDLLQNGMDTEFTITPVLDTSNVRSKIDDIDTALNTTRAIQMASSTSMKLDENRDISFKNPNENVVKEIQNLRNDVLRLGEEVENMQIVLDTGAVVGGIAGPLDTKFGSMMVRNTRERG